jgi:hypothetical protein
MKDNVDSIRKAEVILAKVKGREKLLPLWGKNIIDALRAYKEQYVKAMVIDVEDEAELDQVTQFVRSVKLSPQGNMVEVFDFVTEKVTTIPRAELGHGMTQLHLVGVGPVWVQPSQLGTYTKEGPIFHPPLGTEIRKFIKERILEPLLEVQPQTLGDWEDGFRHDLHAKEQIAVWVVIAERFTAFVNGNQLNKTQRKEVFDLMLHCTNVPNRAAFWETVHLKSLTREQAEAVIAPFEKNWRG